MADEKKGSVEFVILKSTRSEMHFTITNEEDRVKILGMKDYGLEMNAVIKKKMNGMKGEIAGLTQLHTMMLDPIQSHKDIELLKSEKCN